MPKNHSTPEELDAARAARIAARRLEGHERYLNLLRMADRGRKDNGLSSGLEPLIELAENELDALKVAAGGRIAGRKRPHGASVKVRPPTCGVYVDECGAHTLGAKGEFEAFCLAAVIIPDDQYGSLDNDWLNWKKAKLGTSAKIVHEPDLRKGIGPFYFGGDKAKRLDAVESLRERLAALDFTAVVCVVNRPEYVKQYGHSAIDESLPHHVYLMTLHFLMERVVMVLDRFFGSACARVTAESRGYKEDAALQYEFARLQLDGTSYIAASWFRHQLCPGIDFKLKSENNTGLQLADLLARPCAEKVLNPSSDPLRWQEFRQKLCTHEGETAHSILGLKVLPWDGRYQDLWKS
jgi:hypothetical protein